MTDKKRKDEADDAKPGGGQTAEPLDGGETTDPGVKPGTIHPDKQPTDPPPPPNPEGN